jgi:hypothetical protein
MDASPPAGRDIKVAAAARTPERIVATTSLYTLHSSYRLHYGSNHLPRLHLVCGLRFFARTWLTPARQLFENPDLQPVLQVLQVKYFKNKEESAAPDRYRVVVSDGDHHVPTMLGQGTKNLLLTLRFHH